MEGSGNTYKTSHYSIPGRIVDPVTSGGVCHRQIECLHLYDPDSSDGVEEIRGGLPSLQHTTLFPRLSSYRCFET